MRTLFLAGAVIGIGAYAWDTFFLGWLENEGSGTSALASVAPTLLDYGVQSVTGIYDPIWLFFGLFLLFLFFMV